MLNFFLQWVQDNGNDDLTVRGDVPEAETRLLICPLLYSFTLACSVNIVIRTFSTNQAWALVWSGKDAPPWSWTFLWVLWRWTDKGAGLGLILSLKTKQKARHATILILSSTDHGTADGETKYGMREACRERGEGRFGNSLVKSFRNGMLTLRLLSFATISKSAILVSLVS